MARPDIVDRNGTTLGMDIPSASIYAEPRRIVDLDEAIEGILAVFPDLDMLELRGRLDSDTGFAWVKRNVTPAEKTKFGPFVCRASGSGRKPDASIQAVGRAVAWYPSGGGRLPDGGAGGLKHALWQALRSFPSLRFYRSTRSDADGLGPTVRRSVSLSRACGGTGRDRRRHGVWGFRDLC